LLLTWPFGDRVYDVSRVPQVVDAVVEEWQR
jgi:hypothetical protein